LGDEVDHGHIAVDFRRRTALDAGFQHGQISWSSRPKRLTMPILRSKRGPFHASQTLCAGPPLLRKHLAQGRQACFANTLRMAGQGAGRPIPTGRAGPPYPPVTLACMQGAGRQYHPWSRWPAGWPAGWGGWLAGLHAVCYPYPVWVATGLGCVMIS
jgi:hypothetical protein